MAAENEATCESDPNFAVICGFLEKFGVTCGLTNIDFLDLQKMLENTHEVPPDLVELHIKLLRKARKSVSNERWEKALINLCHSYCSQDAWEIERFGYKKARISSKLRILKHLLEMQFDFNSKFKNEINKMSASELRSQPLGRDKLGCAYWLQCDDSCQVRVYKDDPDEETWTLVAKNRDGIVSLISELGSGDSVNIGAEPVVNEDSSSLEIEKPMLDTGQVDSNSSKSEESDNKVEIVTKLVVNKPEEGVEEEKEKVQSSNTEEEKLDAVGEIEEQNLEQPQTEIQEELEDKVGLDLSIKPTISLRIKPLNELLAPKPEEQCGVKGKYMREDKVPIQLRKAVESAGFEIHKANLKHSIDEDSPEDLQYPKKPRLMRPTLLNNKAYMPPVEAENDVEDEIEEPLVVIQGEGNGAENCSSFLTVEETESPIVGEEIEDPVIFVCGEGSGVGSLAGNENEEKDVESPQKNQGNTTDACNSINDLNKKIEKECSTSKIYKLGTVIDVKTDHNKVTASKSPKKLSRWDMETVPEHSLSKDTNETTENKKDFIQNTGQVQELVSKWERIKSNIDVPSKNVEEEKIDDQTTSNPSTNLLTDENKNDNTSPKVPEDAPKKLFFFGPSCLSSKVPSNTQSLTVVESKKNESKTSVSDVNSKHTEDDNDATKVNCDNESHNSELRAEVNLITSEENKHESEEKVEVADVEVNKDVSDSVSTANDEGDGHKSASLNNINEVELDENQEDLNVNQSDDNSKSVCNNNVEKKKLENSTIQTNSSEKSEEHYSTGDNSASKEVSSNEESFIVQNKLHEDNRNKVIKDSSIGNDDLVSSVTSKKDEIIIQSIPNQQIKEKTKNKSKNKEVSKINSSRENEDSQKLLIEEGIQQKNETETEKFVKKGDKPENTELNAPRDTKVECQKNNVNKTSVAAELFKEEKLLPQNKSKTEKASKTKENENLLNKIIDLDIKNCLEKPTSEGKELQKKMNSKMADILLELKAKAATKEKASTSKKHETSKLISVVKNKECKKIDEETEQSVNTSKSEKSISTTHQFVDKNEDRKNTVNIPKPSEVSNKKSNEKAEVSTNSLNYSVEIDEEVKSGNLREIDHVMNLVKNKHEIASDKKDVDQKAETGCTIILNTETVKESLPIESNNLEIVKKENEVVPAESSTKINSADHETKKPTTEIIEIQNDSKDTKSVKTKSEESEKKIVIQIDESEVKAKEENKKGISPSDNELKKECKNDTSKSNESNTNNNGKELIDTKCEVKEVINKINIPDKLLDQKQEVETIKKQEDNMIADINSEKNNTTVKDASNIIDLTENKQHQLIEDLKPENEKQEPKSEDEKANSEDDYDISESNDVVEIKTYEDFEESIENVRAEQNKIKSEKQEKSSEIKTYEDFEESIEVKKIKLTDAKNVKNKKEQNKEDIPVRRTRAASRRLATSAEPAKTQAEPSIMKTISLEDVELCADDTLDCEPVKQPLTLLNFQIDVDSSLPSRITRKRGHTSPPCESIPLDNAKRPKIKGKRSIDAEMRRSIEDKKQQQISSSDDDFSVEIPEVPEEDAEKIKVIHKKGKGRKKGTKKKSAQIDPVESDVSSKKLKEDTTVAVVKKNTPKKRTRLLMGLEIPEKYEMEIEEQGRGVRQSRRIAQIKIKEEAERRKIEELTLPDPKSEKKKKKGKNEDLDYKIEKGHKNAHVISDDDSVHDMEFDKKKKKKRRHKDIRKLFDEANPWRSSSDSSSSNDDEEEEEEIADYSEDEKLVFKSDHEFSPESDLEDNIEIQPMKRARTVKKESDVEEEVDDCNCQKCGKTDHPEWILLCDGCDNGWHCSCLRPPHFVIPEGDWYCPPCQHTTLIKNLQLQLEEFDKKLNKREVEVRRKERLAYVGISLDNVLPAKDDKKLKQKQVADSEESESNSESSVSSETDSDEPIYQLRQRRQAHSYRFNDYDDLINSAIQEEIEAVKTSEYQSRGKDISTIVNAEKEVSNVQTEPKPEMEALPPVVPKNTDLPLTIELPGGKQDSDEEVIKPVKRFRNKKHRKLNSLDVSSGDDAESDEDFKGDSSDEDEDDFDDEFGSGSSEEFGRNGRRFKDAPRRSTRARISRYDKDFINDDSDDAPRRKKTRSIWDESESEESDESWGRRKRKPGRLKAKRLSSPKRRKKSKKKKNSDDSDSEIYRKKKPKIKYGGLDEDDDIGRRTRGKKVTYIDALASDSDEDLTKKAHSKIEESEEEFVLNEEDDEKESEEIEDDDSREEDEKALNKVKDMEALKNTIADPSAASNVDTKLPPLVSSENIPTRTSNISEEFDEPNPIEEINKNVEEMDEKEMEMMIEDEEYANKQLQLVAVQIEKERKRKEREAKKQETQANVEPKIPKKRGRKPKAVLALQEVPNSTPLNLPTDSLPEISLNKSISEDTPKKRRGRGKGKKTLAAEAAAAATKDGPPTSSYENSSNSSLLDSPSQSGKLRIATPPQPFSQNQPTPSVITRMLQNQPDQQNYPLPSVGTKFFTPTGESRPNVQHNENVPASTLPATPATAQTPPSGQFMPGPRGLTAQYRPPGPNMNYPVGRGVPTQPPVAIPPGVQGISHIFHSHHPMDPSPSGGGPINIAGQSSPSAVPPASSSPLSNKSSATPPPPPYVRPQMIRYPPPSNIPPMTNPSTLPPRPLMMSHLQQPRGRLSPYQTNLPPNYHYPPFQPNLNEDRASASPSYANSYEQFPAEGPQEGKLYDDDSEGEFGGLVSYFSSQREDDLDT